MKIKTLLLSLFISLGTLFVNDAHAQTARAQFIHGSADPSIPSVDIFINDVLYVSDLNFTKSTSYIEIPAEEEIRISVSQTGQASVDSLYNFKGFAQTGKLFNIFLRGVVDTTAFAGNPDTNESRSTALQFRINSDAREVPPGNPQNAWVYFYNGITDSTPYTVWASADSTVLTSRGPIQYSAFTGYVPTERGLFVFDQVLPFDNSVINSYSFDLSSVPNSTIAVYSTGFVDTAANQDGAGVQFHAALADGSVLSSALVTSNESDLPTISLFKEVQAYPNPVRNQVNFALADGKRPDSIEIYDTLGRLVIQTRQRNTEITTSALESGFYVALIRDDQGGLHKSNFLVQ